jgi:hypothetical protein
MKESGDVILSGAKIHLELGEALAGRVPPRANETTIFKLPRQAERLPYNLRWRNNWQKWQLMLQS